MRKKTLVILLIIPFVIALLTFVSVVALTNSVAVDIEGINILNFRDNEGFKINGEYKLEAEITYSNNGNSLLKPGADELVWSITNTSEDFTDDVATIEEKDDGFYLKTGSSEGSCRLVCSNSIGSKSDYIEAHIYDKGVILINPLASNSGGQIDPVRYYGESDFVYDNSGNVRKQNAQIPLDIEVITDVGTNAYTFETSPNVSFSRENSTITVNGEGESFVRFEAQGASYINNTYSFNVVDNGVNVYSFDDLMNCTNKSQTGEVVVMQVNLQSRDNALNKDNNGNYLDSYKNSNIKLFGNYDFRNQTFNFNDFIYYEDPKIEAKYIQQFLDQTGNSNNYDYQTQLKVGVRVQKDFYGNGFTINMHELAYPVHGRLDNTTGIFSPDRNLDYFFGPLTFVSIGDLEQMPIIRAYLCDNIGFALDGNNLTVNDVKLQNANNVDNMYNLRFTGTVLEVQGTNNTIENSVIQNGRTCIRAFSSDGLLIDNCLLQNAGEFIVKLGSNEVNPVDHNKQVTVNYNGQEITKSFDDFYNGSAEDLTTANGILSDSITKTFSAAGVDSIVKTLEEIQSGLDNLKGILDSEGNPIFDAHITINNTYFYNSGIYSIAFENSFNGAYLYNGMPSQVQQILQALGAVSPLEIGGTAHPVELTLTGDTRFYDWKNIDDIDAGALIEENISSLASSLDVPELGDILSDLSIDDYFPMKTILKRYAIDHNLTYKVDKDGVTNYYVNRPFAWFGGGYNGSKLINNIDGNDYSVFSEEIEVNLPREVYSKALGGLNPDDMEGTLLTVVNLLSRCVVMATGSHPFKFMTNGTIVNNEKPALFDEVPSYLDLSSRNARN